MNLTRALLVVCVLSLTLAGAGCPAVHRGETQLKWARGQTDPLVLEALHDGEYAVYAIGDAKPRAVIMLKKGDALGFEQKKGDPVTKVTAIGGERRIPLEDGTYYWNYRGKGSK